MTRQEAISAVGDICTRFGCEPPELGDSEVIWVAKVLKTMIAIMEKAQG